MLAYLYNEVQLKNNRPINNRSIVIATAPHNLPDPDFEQIIPVNIIESRGQFLASITIEFLGLWNPITVQYVIDVNRWLTDFDYRLSIANELETIANEKLAESIVIPLGQFQPGVTRKEYINFWNRVDWNDILSDPNYRVKSRR